MVAWGVAMSAEALVVAKIPLTIAKKVALTIRNLRGAVSFEIFMAIDVYYTQWRQSLFKRNPIQS